MNFSGILSRKAGMNNAATSSRVSNPAAAAKARSYAGMSAATGTDDAPVTVIAEMRDVEVIYDEQGHAIREEVSNEQRIVTGMRQDAVDVAPIQGPTPTMPKATATPKQEAAPKQETSPKQDAAPKQAEAPKDTPTQKASAPKTKAAAPKASAPKTKATAPKTAAPKTDTPKAPEKPRYTMLQYSEKCIALFGDTKPIKEELKKIGGRYNPNLHPFGQETNVPGWVFPNKYREDVEQLINRKS